MLVLGVNSGFYARYADFGLYGSKTTNISVNARDSGMTVLAITSINHAAGDNTCSWVHLLRFGYEGNHISSTMIASLSEIVQYRPHFSAASNGALVVFTEVECNMHVALLSNKDFIRI